MKNTLITTNDQLNALLNPEKPKNKDFLCEISGSGPFFLLFSFFRASLIRPPISSLLSVHIIVRGGGGGNKINHKYMGEWGSWYSSSSL